MRFRKLRIAWSIVCGIACLLLIALWVRSYLRIDWVFYLDSSSYTNVASARGNVGIWYDSPPPAVLLLNLAKGWHFTSDPTPPPSRGIWRPSMNTVWIPHWVLVAICAVFGAAPWLRWRFSLRTMLVATTLVAVVLGAIVYATRQ